MSIQLLSDNLVIKPFLIRALEPDAILTIEAMSDPIAKNGSVRGCWCFGLEVGPAAARQSFKLVNSSTAQILKVKTPNGIFAKIDHLGFSVMKIPWRAGEKVTYSSVERGAK